MTRHDNLQHPSDANQPQERNANARWLTYVAATGAAVAAGEVQGETLRFAGPGNIGANGSVALDLNGDSVNDVTIYNLNSTSFYSSGGGRAAASGSILGVVITNSYGTFLYAHKFSNFSSIDPSADIYADTQGYLRDGNGFYYSGWGYYPGPGLLGVRFDIGGNSHMGFVELEVDGSPNGSGLAGNIPVILSFGYETEPDTPLSTPVPEPSSLGLLASGAVGLAAWRRRRRNDSQ